MLGQVRVAGRAELGAGGPGLERGICMNCGDASTAQWTQSPVGSASFVPFLLVMMLHESTSMALGKVCLYPLHGIQYSTECWDNSDSTILLFWTTSMATHFFSLL